MNLQEVNKRLYNKGVLLNMCDTVRGKWRDALSLQELIDLWYDNYDFALSNHYPSNEDIKECFDRELLRKNNVIVDDKYSLLNPANAMVLGKSTVNARFNAYHTGQMWIRDNARVNVYVRDHADVTVCIMDNAMADITIYDPAARVLVMKYSTTAKVEHNGGNIRIRENLKYLNKM